MNPVPRPRGAVRTRGDAGKTAPRRPSYRPGVEPLEDRRLLDARLHQLFVSQAYQDLLRRPPDEGGAAFWAGLLDQGVSHQQIALGIASGPESQELQVQRAFGDLLGRAADTVGLAQARQFLAAGGTVRQLRAAVAASPEYVTRRGGDNPAGFLAAIYEDALGRPISPPESREWLGALAILAGHAGPPALAQAVAGHVLGSPEAGRAWVGGLYRDFLHRPADAGGLDYWAHILQLGASEGQVIAGFVGSQEYRGRLPVPADVPLTLALTLDTAHVAQALVTREGGTVTATAADGSAFSLQVPAGALLDDQVITLTPVRAVSDLPFSGGLLAAAHLSPAGLGFFRPVTLTIDVPPGFDAGQVAGFAYQGEGQGFHLYPVQVDGPRLTFQVTHFSGVGAGLAVPADLSALFGLAAPGQFDAQFYQLAAPAVNQVEAGLSPDLTPLTAIVTQWYDTAVRPKLIPGQTSDGFLLAGLREFSSWDLAVSITSNVIGPSFESLMASRIQEGKGLATSGLGNAIARANNRCLAGEGLAAAEDALRWQSLAEDLSEAEQVLSPEENGLDLDTVLSELCVGVHYAQVSFPDTVAEGAAAQLELRAGLVFGDGNPVFGVPLYVLVQPGGTTDDNFSVGTTDPEGIFTKTVTPAAGSVEVTLQIKTCLDLESFPLLQQRLCQPAVVTRGGVSVNPTSATVAAGGSVAFTAQRLGFADPGIAVTWSATGGTITPGGLFTAGSTAGTFTLTATSVANPQKRGQAVVTIEEPPPIVTSSMSAVVEASLGHFVAQVRSGGVNINGPHVLTQPRFRRGVPFDLTAGCSLPAGETVTTSSSTCTGTIEVHSMVTAPGPNVIVWDVSSAPADQVSAQLLLRLDFTEAGVLHLEAGVPELWVRELGLNAQGQVLVEGDLVPREGPPTSSLMLSGPGTRWIQAMMFLNNGQEVPVTSSARWLTLTFTPSS